MNRMLLRVCAIGGAVLCSLVVFVGTAQAATGVGRSGSTLYVTASAGHNNNITITTFSTAAIRVQDSGDAVAPSDGCTRVDNNTAQCSIVGITGIVVRAGNLNDEVTNNVSTPSSLDGGDGDDKLTGGPGNDILNGGTDTDELNGKGGTDTADYRSRAGNLNVSLDGGWNDGEYMEDENDNVQSDVENIQSGSGNDTLVGSDGANVLMGGNGNDRIVGLKGNDTADYGASQDGADEFAGGEGIDTASYSRRVHVVNVSLDSVANDGGSGGEGDNNRIDVENATSGAGGDTLSGNSLANTLNGQEGNDHIYGLAGDDTLIGGRGRTSSMVAPAWTTAAMILSTAGRNAIPDPPSLAAAPGHRPSA